MPRHNQLSGYQAGTDSFNRIYDFLIFICAVVQGSIKIWSWGVGYVTRTEHETFEICHKYQFVFPIMQ